MNCFHHVQTTHTHTQDVLSVTQGLARFFYQQGTGCIVHYDYKYTLLQKREYFLCNKILFSNQNKAFLFSLYYMYNETHCLSPV